MKPRYLDGIDSPADLKRVPREDLVLLAEEMRERITDIVYRTGGHLGSALGVVEITIALHYLYDFSRDFLVLDTGHQCYPHKMLTGRRARFETLRQKGGLSGFPSVSESPYDHFTTGHAGNAISSVFGLRVGSEIVGSPSSGVAVVGDAAIQSGVAFEAINAAGAMGKNLLVVLNDNEWSISKSVGALAAYFSRVRTEPLFTAAKKELHQFLNSIPVFGERMDKQVDRWADLARQAIVPGHVFEALGVKYYGPIDGHNLPELVEMVERIQKIQGVVLLHLLTQKGKGGEGAERDPQRLHGVSPKSTKKAKSWTQAFTEIMLRLAEKNPKVAAITAGMPDGTGLKPFAEKFPDRFFDVGISEQHGVAFSAGLARTGVRPVAAIYSTFLQRAYDQVFQESLLSGNPVVFALDRAGLVGEDGPTHNGLFDIAFLRTMPGVALCAPRDESEFAAMMEWAISQKEESVAIRYPRGNCPDPEIPGARPPVRMGRAEILRPGADGAVLAYGAMVQTAWEAAEILSKKGIEFAVVNARFAKPLDRELIGRLLREHRRLFTLEDHALAGGFGSAVLELASQLEGEARIRCYGVPDRFIEHAPRGEQLKDLGLDPASLARSWEESLAETTVR